ncbi:SecY-interacting protein [Shewanella sp. A32]|uniref:SecY-interacting protein n=1 Tax=Shewanella sp. A32 TaxID=3031327 RepID=UPI0023B896EC|nr:SecY-interacting protein [Shewanella sp. A32]MDF0534475.1 SecY-interacting protein [Shewanella sp. A32]
MSCAEALEQFFAQYQQCYQSALGEFPRFYAGGEPSECVLDWEHDDPVQWQAIHRQSTASFANVGEALSINLHPDIEQFYGHFFAGPLKFDSPFGSGELLQVWNDKDFGYLQENLIGHLMMKKRLRQSPTWFIGILEQHEEMLTVDNNDGSVWAERPGEAPYERLADNLADFLRMLSPRVTDAVRYQELDDSTSASVHPGIFASLKRMWLNLFPKR